MLKGFLNILIKELKELVRDPKILLGMIIVPVIIFPVLGGIMSFSIQSAQEQAQKATILILDNDGENWSQLFIGLLNQTFKVYVEENVNLTNEVVQELLSQYNTTQIIEFPKDFSQNVTMHLSGNKEINATLKFYGVFTGGGIFESIGSLPIDNLVNQFNRVNAPDIVYTEKSSIVKGEIKEVDPAQLYGLMMAQSIALPITIMILLQVAMQIAATSVAMEKEEKTLETLLTLPMDRFAILMGKLSGSIIVAAVGALAFMVGYNYMLSSFTMQIPAESGLDLASLELAPSLFGYLLLGISLFVTLISALALAVIVSAFAEDVRSAQSLVGYIYPLIFIPALALMYLDRNTLPFALRVVFYAIPYSHPVIASKAVIMGDYWSAILGIVYVAAFTLVVMYAASRLFVTEKILTAKLKFRGLWKRKKRPTEEFQ
ncbi:MAG: ABC transporter permease [Candidatus Bathycorpusculaceae bacterium]